MASYAAVAANAFAALDVLGDAEALQQEAERSGPSADSSADEKAAPSQPSGRRLRNPLAWVDLEMTGLDVERDTIIELACILTDGELKTEIKGPCLAIHHSDEVLDAMNDWCKEHHGRSGLTQRVRDSPVSLSQAEDALLAFLQQHTDENSTQLAGNSIHVDRMFLVKYMPRVVAHLNYRVVDVSSIKELARRWFPQTYRKAPRKELKHTAESDIRESIAELKYYRKAVFKDPKQCK